MKLNYIERNYSTAEKERLRKVQAILDGETSKSSNLPHETRNIWQEVAFFQFTWSDEFYESKSLKLLLNTGLEQQRWLQIL